MKSTIVVLPDIRSAHNVGSIFRTADAVGVKKIYLIGHTPTPLDRFGRMRKDIAKVALGGEQSVSWEYFKTFDEALGVLRKENYKIVGVEQSKNSVPYTKIPHDEKTAFIFGNEVEGLSDEILKECDVIAEIRMAGKKESLNVSVTAGIVLFSFREGTQ